MPIYVVVDIGCIECGESTEVVGVFSNKEKAESLAAKGSYFSTRGQHIVEMFEVEGIDITPKTEAENA